MSERIDVHNKPYKNLDPFVLLKTVFLDSEGTVLVIRFSKIQTPNTTVVASSYLTAHFVNSYATHLRSKLEGNRLFDSYIKM